MIVGEGLSFQLWTARHTSARLRSLDHTLAVVPHHTVAARPGTWRDRSRSTWSASFVLARIQRHRRRDLAGVIQDKPGQRALGVEQSAVVLQDFGEGAVYLRLGAGNLTACRSVYCTVGPDSRRSLLPGRPQEQDY